MAKRRGAADADTRKAIAKGRAAVRDSRQMILDSAAAIERAGIGGGVEPSGAPSGRTPVILQVGPRDFSALVWVRDEGEEPVYRVVKDRIKAASTAAVLARKLQRDRS